MKFSMMFVAAIAVFTITSCSSDDDNTVLYEFNQKNVIDQYQLQALREREEKTIHVQGIPIDVVTDTEGDTFGVSWDFSSNDTLTLDGSYRVKEQRNVEGKGSDTIYIVHKDNEKLSYSVKPDKNEIVIDGVVYQVRDFRPGGLSLFTEKSGDNSTLTREIELTK